MHDFWGSLNDRQKRNRTGSHLLNNFQKRKTSFVLFYFINRLEAWMLYEQRKPARL